MAVFIMFFFYLFFFSLHEVLLSNVVNGRLAVRDVKDSEEESGAEQIGGSTAERMKYF